MVSHACAACGKSITEVALAQGTAVEHGGRIYCATCAALIVTPGSMPIVGEDVQETDPLKGQGLKVLQEFKVSFKAPDIPSPFAVVDNSTDGVAPDMAMQNDDDEWFKPRNGGSVGTADAGSAPRIKPAAAAAPKPAPIPVAPRQAAKSSGVSSRVGMKPATTGPTAPSTSGRVAPPSARMNAVPPPAAVSPKASAILEPKKSGRISSVKPSAAPLSKSSSRRGSAIRPPAAEAPTPEVAEVVDEPEQDVVAAPSIDRKGKSSRRMPAAKSSASARATGSSRSSKRDEREEKDGKKDKDKKKGAKGGDMTMIYGGVAAVVVLIVIAVFATGRGKDDETGAKAVTPEAVDKTPSGQYASQAEKELAGGARSKAMEFYTKAAAQAEREGNTTKARNYNMKAMDLMKSSKLKDH